MQAPSTIEIVEGSKFSVQAITYQVQIVYHKSLSSLSHKHISGVNPLNGSKDKVRYTVAHRMVVVVMIGLHN